MHSFSPLCNLQPPIQLLTWGFFLDSGRKPTWKLCTDWHPSSGWNRSLRRHCATHTHYSVKYETVIKNKQKETGILQYELFMTYNLIISDIVLLFYHNEDYMLPLGIVLKISPDKFQACHVFLFWRQSKRDSLPPFSRVKETKCTEHQCCCFVCRNRNQQTKRSYRSRQNVPLITLKYLHVTANLTKCIWKRRKQADLKRKSDFPFKVASTQVLEWM